MYKYIVMSMCCLALPCFAATTVPLSVLKNGNPVQEGTAVLVAEETLLVN